MNRLAMTQQGGRNRLLARCLPVSDPFYRRWCRIRKWVWLAVILLIVGLSVWWSAATRFLAVKRVRVIDQVRVSPSVVPSAQIIARANQWRGKWLWTDFDQLEQQLLRQFPALASVETTTGFPDTLEVRLLPRVPLCQLITPSGIYLVDRSGVIFARLDKKVEMLPRLEATTKPEIGKHVSTSGVVLGLAIMSALRSSTPALEQVRLHDGQLDVKLAGPPLFLISDDRSPEELIPQLQALLAKFAVDQQYPSEVDMRFDRPILRK